LRVSELALVQYNVTFAERSGFYLSPDWIEEENKNGDQSGHDRGGTQPAMSLGRCWCGARCRCWCSVAARRRRVVATRRRRVIATRRRCVVGTRRRRVVATGRDSIVVCRWAVIG
jgi:hypothetical protein